MPELGLTLKTSRRSLQTFPFLENHSREFALPSRRPEEVFKTFSFVGTLSRELCPALRTSRESLQNVFNSRDYFQKTGPNPQNVQKKSLKRFHLWGLLPDVLRTRSCAHWEATIEEINPDVQAFIYWTVLCRYIQQNVLTSLIPT